MILTRDKIYLLFIFILGGALVLSFIFRSPKSIDLYEDEIKLLKENNKKLISSNDSIKKLNIKLQVEINDILIKIDSTLVLLNLTDDKLKDLENKRDEIPTIINNMDSDDVTFNLSNYLKGRD